MFSDAFAALTTNLEIYTSKKHSRIISHMKVNPYISETFEIKFWHLNYDLTVDLLIALLVYI